MRRSSGPGPSRRRSALPSGAEGTINQALDVTGMRRAGYRGLPKVHLQHAFSATALNVVRLDAYWTDSRLRRTRTSRLERLAYRLTAQPQEIEQQSHPLAKIQTKGSGGWRTLDGASRWLLVRSYLSTARNHGLNPMTVLRDLFAGNAWLPPARAYPASE
ncbi:transposase [Streptomyces sp. NPDC002659]|uniref:transposase n=1 Tax=Streptomyces sp. NPDC002659 TaxID=3364656 RepID=UPI0036C59AEB